MRLLTAIFITTGTALLLVGVIMVFRFELTVPDVGESTSEVLNIQEVMAGLTKPVILVLAGMGMMLGGVACAVTERKGRPAAGELSTPSHTDEKAS
ncbi:hypothetical protein ACQP1V_25855 [Microtetraspora malaysiensis]|uniref:hypothetical protein n=1 Tax=Microtetraspora malaysiensis TaxID=161358 RepID=UPI003D8D4A34